MNSRSTGSYSTVVAYQTSVLMEFFVKIVFVIFNVKPGTQPDIFQGRGGFMKLGHFDKYFMKKSRKKIL